MEARQLRAFFLFLDDFSVTVYFYSHLRCGVSRRFEIVADNITQTWHDSRTRMEPRQVLRAVFSASTRMSQTGRFC